MVVARCIHQTCGECELRLKESRFKAGQRLALLLPNCPIMLAVTVAIWRLGGTVVPIDYRSGYVSLIKQLKHADVFAAITFRGCANLVPLISEKAFHALLPSLDEPGENIAGRSCAEEDTDTAVIFFTSGTIGEAKAVPLTRYLIAEIDAMEHIDILTGYDAFLNVLPNYNALGLSAGP